MPRVKNTSINKATGSDKKSLATRKRKPSQKSKSDKPANLVTEEIIKDEGAKEEKKSNAKKIVRKPKAKPVVIDIIRDEDLVGDDETFFSNEDLQLNSSSVYEVKETNELADVDSQKQFFSDLVTEIKSRHEIEELSEDIKEEKKIANTKKSFNLYSRLVWKFLILVSFLAAIVFYLSFSKLTILITPKVEAMNDNLFLKVLGGENQAAAVNDGREEISGTINELDLEISKTYQATGEEYIGEEISGKVFLINNHTRDQPLMATTRILTADNKLFRIKNAVTVPARGEVEVEIYADEISAEMAINPTRFTIPGLWVGIQDKIYAESREPFVYQQKVERHVRASDIQLANQEATNLLLEKAKESQSLSNQDGILYKVLEPVEITLDAKAGDRVDEFSMTASAKVVVVTFSQEEVSQLAVARLNILVPDDKELADLEADNLSYVLESYDKDAQVATIKTSFSGSVILKSNAEVINRERLVNLNAEQISSYLQEYPEISSYELDFFPNFIKKAPHLVDRIQIKIKK